jgi:formamidopyrimidine-DNA glycosylase
MPELPEVENYRRYLTKNGLRQRIAAVRVDEPRSLRKTTPDKLSRGLKGHAFTKTRRHGKHLLIGLDGDEGWLAVHFGMTGRLLYVDDANAAPDNERVRIEFENGHHLSYIDARLLGRLELATDIDAFVEHRDLGPDVLDKALDADVFGDLLSKRRGGLKAALMDQSLVAGLGNLYVDETLFQAKLHPLARVQDLTPAELRRIHNKMHLVLKAAIDAGAGWKGYYKRLPKGFLTPHRAAGQPCPRANGNIRKITAAGRSTYFCDVCQKA